MWHCAAPSAWWRRGGDHDAGRHRPGARRLPRANAAVGTRHVRSLRHLHRRPARLLRSARRGRPATSAELAARTGTAERYVREWLEQQTVAGVLEVDDAEAEAASAPLPPARRPCRSAGRPREPELPGAAGPARRSARSRPLAALLDAYRTGGGVPYARLRRRPARGPGRHRTARLFLQQLGQEWLPALPDVHARLQADPPARVADIGCGRGWSSIGIAQRYPRRWWTASTWTTPRLTWRGPMPRRPASPIG